MSYVPTLFNGAENATIPEVGWTRKLRFGRPNGNGAFSGGLKFIFWIEVAVGVTTK